MRADFIHIIVKSTGPYHRISKHWGDDFCVFPLPCGSSALSRGSVVAGIVIHDAVELGAIGLSHLWSVPQCNIPRP